jgi:integrase
VSHWRGVCKVARCVTEPWRPLVEFLVASGCRWGEATALHPSDVDRSAGTVRVMRAWKRTYDRGGYEIGPPKTKRSIRTINVPKPVLDKLDYPNGLVISEPGRSSYTSQRDSRPNLATRR